MSKFKDFSVDDFFEFVGKCVTFFILAIIGTIAVIGVTGLAYAFGFILSFWSAFVCMHLWNWFLVPALHLPPVSFFLMMGVMVAFHAIKGYPYKKEKKEEEDEEKKFLQIVKEGSMPIVTYGACYAFALLSGWIIHTYFM